MPNDYAVFSATYFGNSLWWYGSHGSDRVKVRERQSESESEKETERERKSEKESERGWRNRREKERKRNKRIKQTNKIKIRSFYTFYGDCYSLSAH